MFTGALLTSFALGEMEYERCVELVNSPVGATPPVDLEGEDEEDEELSESESSEDECTPAVVDKGVSRTGRVRRGRVTHRKR